MNEQQRETLINLLCVMFGIASYLLVVFWYLGLACAIVAVILAIYHDHYYPANRATIVGMWLGIVYVIMFVLIGVFILGYYHLLHVQI